MSPGLRLAFVGKGGAGKSTVAGTVCRHLGRMCVPVLALDVDTMPGLALSLGVPGEGCRLPAGLAEVVDGRWRIVRTTRPSRLVERYAATAPDGVRLVELGKLPGRVEPSVTVAFRWVMEGFRRPGWAVIADLAAGTRQPMYRWARFAKHVVVVADSSAKSLMTARRLAPLATHVLANKVRSEAEALAVAAASGLPLLGAVPYDQAVVDADRRGVALVDFAAGSPACRALAELAERIKEEQ